MSIDLTSARNALSATFHTNACTVIRPITTNVNGIVTQTYTTIHSTTCHIVPNFANNLTPYAAPAASGEAGERPSVYFGLPYGTDIKREDRIVVNGYRYRIVLVTPLPQFALETYVGGVDVTGET